MINVITETGKDAPLQSDYIKYTAPMSLMKLLYIHQIITQHLKIITETCKDAPLHRSNHSIINVITETGKYAPLHRSNHSIINVIIENCKDAPLHITNRLHQTHCSDITYEITTYIDQVDQITSI